MNRILSALEGIPGQARAMPNGLWQRFCALARSHPEASAVQDGEGIITYGALLAQAVQASEALERAGATGQCCVGLSLPKTQALICYVLACWRIGATATFLAPDQPEAEIARKADKACVAFRVSSDAAGQGAPGLPGTWISATGMASQPPYFHTVRPDTVQGGRLAFVAFTSGTTGSAKLVGLSDTGLLAVISALISHYRLSQDSRLAWTAALSFDSAIAEVLLCLLGSACLVLPPSPRALVGERLEALVREQALTHLIVTPSILETASPERFPAPLKIALVGEPLSRSVIRRWCENRTLFNAYGPSEAGICATITGPLEATSEVTVGKPLAGVEIVVVDEHLQAMAPGELGEVAIGGAGVSLGYLDQPALSARRFVELAGRRGTFYLSGDLGRLSASGELILAGRNDDQVKINGRRIDLQALQDPLTEHQGILRACAARYEAADGRYVLAAYLQLANPDAPVTLTGLRAHLAQRVPGYMVPTRWFVTSALPLTANGKTDRRGLEDHVLYELTPPPGALAETPLERAIAAIFSRVLAVEAVGREDDFFALGGSSVDSIRAVDLLRAELGEQFSFEAFMHAPTVAALARAAQTATAGRQPEGPGDLPTRYPLYPADGAEPRTVFLTGASGFLGEAIVEQLVSRVGTQVILAGRRNRPVTAATLATGEVHRVAVGFDLERPLSAPALAALQAADCVIHCAARVNLAYDHQALYPANVHATHRLLCASAEGRPKRFAYLSSRSAVDTHDASGYATTKRDAERQVFAAFARGLAGHVYRPGRITGHTVTGRHNPNDFMVRFIAACLMVRQYPAEITHFTGIPVDAMAALVVNSITRGTADGTLIEPADVERFPLEQLHGFVTEAGLRMQAVTLRRWNATAASNSDVVRLYPDILIAMTRHAVVMLANYGMTAAVRACLAPAAEAERVRRLALDVLDTHDSLVKGQRT